jgi:ubiquinone/menaquinone biosynthesis C-methylase UbiE
MRLETYRGRLQSATEAEKYATRFERGSRKRIERREQRAVRRVFVGLPDCRSVLDVPCGAGRFLAILAHGGRIVIEADVAMEVLEFARQRSADSPIQCLFARADAARLPLADGSVDAVFSNRLLHHILEASQRAAILREFHRVARRYVVISFFDYHAFGTVRRFLKLLRGRRPRYDLQPTRAQFEAELQACGLRVRGLVPTGPVWVAQKFYALEKGEKR